MSNREYSSAIKEFSNAIQSDPNYSGAYRYRGWSYDQLLQDEKAIQDYDMAIRLAPNEPSFFVERGMAYSSLEQYPDAIKDYD